MKLVLPFILFALLLFACSADEQRQVAEDTNEEPQETEQQFTELEIQILNWFDNQQLSNGLLESTENSNFVSLYDNALAALVYIMKEDYEKAESIFDFFNERIDTELNNGVGGFSQFRDRNGNPSNHRWMGDNAWLAVALNNYKAKTGSSQYDALSNALNSWLMSLQDSDGGLFAGYDNNSNLLNYKVSEGNIDAYNAITGYSNFHKQILEFLETNRWRSNDHTLVAWPENPSYLYALDLHSWGYLIFEDFPIQALTSANRFLNTQTLQNDVEITGYCFDEDKDTVWLEGTAQMALAFNEAGVTSKKQLYLSEMEKVVLQSTLHPNSSGFAYATNLGTTYGADQLWEGADTNICISSSAWYLFAKQGFNPFEVGRTKNVPVNDMFWVN